MLVHLKKNNKQTKNQWQQKKEHQATQYYGYTKLYLLNISPPTFINICDDLIVTRNTVK